MQGNVKVQLYRTNNNCMNFMNRIVTALLQGANSFFARIASRNILLYYPFWSFRHIVNIHDTASNHSFQKIFI